ncbi:MAG: hypothetical protein AB8I08_38305 [Sandaracinaceae bacterium]
MIADRFEVTRSEKWSPPEGRDRETGRPVTFVPVAPYSVFDAVSLEVQARVVRELNDPRLVPPLHDAPLVLPGAPEKKIKKSTLLSQAMALLEVLAKARRMGLTVAADLAWVEDGAIRLPAPSRPPGLHFASWHHRNDVLLWGVRTWLDRRLGRFSKGWLDELDTTAPRAFIRTLAERAKVPPPDFDWPAAGSVDALVDFDVAIERAEAVVSGATDERDPARFYGTLPLAAALHHRACQRWQAGDADGARQDAERAVELDPHARYLTSAALFADGDDRAAALHDRAVAALAAPDHEDGIRLTDSGRDTPEREARDAARTRTARAVFRVHTGDKSGARTDLEAAMARHATELAARWYQRVGPAGA